MNWIDDGRGLRLLDLSSRDEVRLRSDSAGCDMLWLEVGLSSDSVEAMGDVVADMVLRLEPFLR